jgi:hypothetical protein
MAHYFVSYTGVDAEWAEWIAWTLEENGHSTILQKWDFRPGSNFVVEMQKAASAADQTIAVLSSDYLQLGFATPEWAAAIAQDPTGSKFKLIPVRVRECRPDGLWKGIVYVDLVNLDESSAKTRLIEGVNPARAKPPLAPRFPGATLSVFHEAVPFPGEARKNKSPTPYEPRIRRTPTDLEQRRFLKEGFSQVKTHFENGFAAIKRSNPEIDVDLTTVSSTEFIAEVFVNGKSKCRCKVWLGEMFGRNEISYAEGPSIRGNAINESLSVTSTNGNLAFRTMMGAMFGRMAEGVDGESLDVEQAAEYLWRRFVSLLEQ